MKQPITFEDIAKILEGIDKEETIDQRGWWETSTGAEFGKQKLAEIKALFDDNERLYYRSERGLIAIE